MNNNLKFYKVLPETYAMLTSSNLTIHDRVTHIVLHGSRGIAGGARPDSDIDLSLITDIDGLSGSELESLLKDVAETTLNNWTGAIKADIAVIFDKRNCGLKCFFDETWNDAVCNSDGAGCFGIYKILEGFSGIIENAGVEVQKMYPCTVVWARD